MQLGVDLTVGRGVWKISRRLRRRRSWLTRKPPTTGGLTLSVARAQRRSGACQSLVGRSVGRRTIGLEVRTGRHHINDEEEKGEKKAAFAFERWTASRESRACSTSIVAPACLVRCLHSRCWRCCRHTSSWRWWSASYALVGPAEML